MSNPNNTTQPMEELETQIDNWWGDWNVGPMPSRPKEKLAKLIALQETKARINELESHRNQIGFDVGAIHLLKDDVDERLDQLNPNTDRKKVDV